MSYESPIIRPPSEWRSGLIRITRGCKWNRCLFCGIYPHLGEPVFGIRSYDEISQDIDFLKCKRPDIDSIFLGDADPIIVGSQLFTDILQRINTVFSAKRITTYARFSTLYNLGEEAICQLAQAGLGRIHLGMESGDNTTLIFQKKGQNRKMIKTVGNWLKKAEIEISVYVLLGLAGALRWQEHARNTASLLNDIEPQFIRIRRLYLYPASPDGSPGCPLSSKVAQGEFIEQPPEGTILELKLLVQKLNAMPSFLTCDHRNNYLNISGYLDVDKPEMLEAIHQFLMLPTQERQQHYDSIVSGT